MSKKYNCCTRTEVRGSPQEMAEHNEREICLTQKSHSFKECPALCLKLIYTPYIIKHLPLPILCINLLRKGCGVHSSCRNIIVQKEGDCGEAWQFVNSLRNTQRIHCLSRFQFLHIRQPHSGAVQTAFMPIPIKVLIWHYPRAWVNQGTMCMLAMEVPPQVSPGLGLGQIYAILMLGESTTSWNSEECSYKAATSSGDRRV